MGARRLTVLGIAALVPFALLQSGCGSSEDGATTAGGKPSGTSQVFIASLGELQNTLTYNIINLVTWSNRLQRMTKAGDVEEAKNAYVKARAWLGRIEPVLPAMPEVKAPLLDSEEEGYPWIEDGLWTGNVEDLEAGMKGFHKDMERMRVRVEHADLEPAELSGLAIDSLSSIEAADLDEGNGHAPNISLIEAATNIEGVRALFSAIKPALKSNPSLREEMKQSFVDLFQTLGRMEGRTEQFMRLYTGTPGTEFPVFEDRPIPFASQLDKQVQELAELFSQTSTIPELE